MSEENDNPVKYEEEEILIIKSLLLFLSSLHHMDTHRERVRGQDKKTWFLFFSFLAQQQEKEDSLEGYPYPAVPWHSCYEPTRRRRVFKRLGRRGRA